MELPRRIVVPTDFSPASDAALDYAVGLAERIGATILLVHAFRPPALDLPEGAVTGLGGATDRILLAAEKALASAVECFSGRKVEIETIIKRGAPWRVIVSVAREATDLEGALIVMGTNAKRGLSRALMLSSVAEKVVRMAPCPALAIPGPGA